MKKTMKSILALSLAVSGVCLAACGKEEELALGKEMLKCDTQLDAVVQVNIGTADVAVIDSIMAGYYETTGDYAGKIKTVNGLVFTEEQYAIAGRKEDGAFLSKINEALIALAASGELTEISNTFGVTDSLAVTAQTQNPLASSNDQSWETIQNSKEIVIGYTLFAPIAYEDGNTLTGFDVELARAVVDYLNVTYSLELELNFQIIDWNNKEALLKGNTIDLIWNGMTITPEREEGMCLSVPYLYNRQVAVVKTENAEKYTTDKASFKDAVIAVEAGSAGESVVKGKEA